MVMPLMITSSRNGSRSQVMALALSLASCPGSAAAPAYLETASRSNSTRTAPGSAATLSSSSASAHCRPLLAPECHPRGTFPWCYQILPTALCCCALPHRPHRRNCALRWLHHGRHHGHYRGYRHVHYRAHRYREPASSRAARLASSPQHHCSCTASRATHSCR